MMSSHVVDGTVVLHMVQGHRVGAQIRVGPGHWTIGRAPDCDVVVDDDGVSRRHARIEIGAHGVVVADIGSTNGTWVNGRRLRQPHMLMAGDELRMGAAVLRVGDGRRRRGAVSPLRVVVVGAVAGAALAALTPVITWATNWTGMGPFLAPVVVATVASLIEVAKEHLTKPRGEPVASAGPRSPTGPPWPADQPTAPVTRPAPRRHAPLWVGVAVAILVVGGGGIAVAYGARALTTFVTGNETGELRLSAPVADEADGVTTTVSSVEQTRHFTRVHIEVRNGLANTITLNSATLSAPGSTTLESDPFRSDWTRTIAPGQTNSGVLVFRGALQPEATTAQLSFPTVFEMGFDGPEAIVVDDLALTAVE